MIALLDCSWPFSQAGEAMQALARHVQLPFLSPLLPPAPPSVIAGDRDASRTWIESTAGCLNLQVERRRLTYRALSELPGSGPALLEINFAGELRLLAIVGARGKQFMLIPPQLTPVRSTVEEFRGLITASLECDLKTTLAGILNDAGISERSRPAVLQSLLEERLGEAVIAPLWKLDLPASAGLWSHARHAGLPKNLAAFLCAYSFEYGLWILSWALVGRWAIEGQVDRGWLLGWALILLTLIPVHMFARWQQAKLVISGGWILMRLLLEGSFKLKPEEVRHQGVGQLLGRVLGIREALQSLALAGGISAVVSAIQLGVAVALFGFSQGALLAFLLLSWIVLTVVFALAFHRRRQAWTDACLEVTQELIERIIGHGTRLAQQPRERWHEGEDECLARYIKQSKRADWLNIACMSLLPRSWLIAGLASMAPGMVSGQLSLPLLAARLGVILLAYAALRTLSSSLATLSGAVIAAERAGNFLLAARRVESPGDPAIAVAASSTGGTLLEMRDVTFRYPQRANDAIQHAFVQIERGDRILLQGPSGGGKSTLVAMASGIRVPDSGLLFLRGIDRKTLGDRQWRRHVVASPQSHENHILTGSLAYNLLLGRNWPADADDLAEADEICRELGMGPLLDRMPAGLMQIVGESGWQLSNGEKSRVYLARALLQRADLVVLDETSAALDPETAQHAIDCVRRRAPTLLCVAHV